jgi:hypothetical protein
MTFTPEIIAKAKTARNAEELISMAKTEGFSKLTAEEAAKFYKQLNPKRGEIADDELDNVAGGGQCEDNLSGEYKEYFTL